MITIAGISFIIRESSIVSAMLCLTLISSIGSLPGRYNTKGEEEPGASARNECTGILGTLIFTLMCTWINDCFEIRRTYFTERRSEGGLLPGQFCSAVPAGEILCQSNNVQYLSVCK